MFFHIPKEKRTRITKSELLVRDRQRVEEFERTKQDFLSQIVDLRTMTTGSNLHSPMFSDKSNFQPPEEGVKVKPAITKKLMVDGVCIALDLPLPSIDKKVKFVIFLKK